MKKQNLFFIVIICIVFNFLNSFCQDSSYADPLSPGKLIDKYQLGIVTGINYPSSPAELTKNPQTSTPKVQQSLLNGVDGLGFKSTYDLGIFFRYHISKSLYLGTELGFTGWKSQVNCNCTDSVWKSNNSLSMGDISFLLQYNFFDNFYISPELSYNLFGVHSTENDKVRGILDFSKAYSRIGAGIAVGYELPVYKRFSIDIFAKARVANLLMLHTTGTDFSLPQAIVASGTNIKESTIVMLSLNLGFVYSFYY